MARNGHASIVRVGEPAHGVVEPGLRLAGVDPIAGTNKSTWRGTPMALDRHLPRDVDVIIGHSRFGGAAAAELARMYPDAYRVHLLHTEPELLDRLKGAPAEGIAHAATERQLMNQADMVVGMGPRLAAEARRLAITPERPDPLVYEMLPGIETGPLAPARDNARDGYNLYVIGRAGDSIKGVDDAAGVVRALRDRGFDARLTVRGVPDDLIADQHERLLRIIGDDPDLVRVLPYTTEQTVKTADLHDSDLVLVPSRTEGFGLTATEAVGHGVPILVARDATGAGRFLSDPARIPQELVEGSTVAEDVPGAPIPPGMDEDRVPLWADYAEAVLKNLDQHRARAAQLRSYTTENYSWGRSMAELVAAIQAARPGR